MSFRNTLKGAVVSSLSLNHPILVLAPLNEVKAAMALIAQEESFLAALTAAVCVATLTPS